MLPAQDPTTQLVEFLQLQAAKVSTPDSPWFRVFSVVEGFERFVARVTGMVRGGPLAIKAEDLTRFYEYLHQHGAQIDDNERAVGFALLAKVLEQEATSQQWAPGPVEGPPSYAPGAFPNPSPHSPNTPWAPPSGPPTGPGIPGPQPGRTFSAPIAITVLAGLVVVLLAVVLIQALGSSGSPGTNTAGPTSNGAVGNTPAPPQPTTQPSQATSPAEPSPSPTPGSIRYSGTFQLNYGPETLDLDSNPPHKVHNSVDGDLSTNPGGDTTEFSAFGSDRQVVEWAGDGEPDFKKCQEAILTGGGSQQDNIPPGHYICVRTDKRRIARLKIAKISTFAVRGTMIVWETDGS